MLHSLWAVLRTSAIKVIFNIDDPVKSQRSDDKVKCFRCKACKYEGMRRTYWYVAMIYPVKYRYLKFQIFS
jgi:hypothetical protein